MQFLALTITRRQVAFLTLASLGGGVLAGLTATSDLPWAGSAVAVAVSIFTIGTITVGMASRLAHRVAQVEARLVLTQLVPDPDIWLDFTNYSARPDFLLSVARETIRRRPFTIVELGAGVSTLIVATLLRDVVGRGRLYCLENDIAYAETVRGRLREKVLDQYATILDAPLCPLSSGSGVWYDLRTVEQLPDTIDLLIVDGPAARYGKRVRVPALTILGSRLKRGAVVLLDDAKRPGERWVVREWQRLFSVVQVRAEGTERGLVIVEWPGHP